MLYINLIYYFIIYVFMYIICPKSIKYLKNASYSEFLRDFFALIDPFQPSSMEHINGQQDSNWTITEEGSLMVK